MMHPSYKNQRKLQSIFVVIREPFQSQDMWLLDTCNLLQIAMCYIMSWFGSLENLFCSLLRQHIVHVRILEFPLFSQSNYFSEI